jgi:hypothetical protein
LIFTFIDDDRNVNVGCPVSRMLYYGDRVKVGIDDQWCAWLYLSFTPSSLAQDPLGAIVVGVAVSYLIKQQCILKSFQTIEISIKMFWTVLLRNKF